MLACVALIVATACGDDPVVPTGTNGNLLSASVDGAAFVPTSITAIRSNGRIYIVGSNSLRTLTITMPAPANASTVQMLPGDATSNILLAEGAPPNNPVWTTSDVPVDTTLINNTITFTSLSTTAASGTFSFKAGPAAGTPAIGTRTVSNGSFSVKF